MATFQFTENLFSKALLGCWDRKREYWCQNACRENILALQYLLASIRTIFLKAAAAPDDALRSHGFKETNQLGVWHFTAFAAKCLFARFCRVRKGFFLLMLSWTPSPSTGSMLCFHSQPSLGKYCNSQFFSALPDLFILGPFPRNLHWTDVFQLQIQVSYSFSWDYCWFSLVHIQFSALFFSGKDLSYHDPDSTKLPAPNTTSWFPTGVQVSPQPSPGFVEALPLVGNNLCINCKVNTEGVYISFPLSRPEWLRKLSMLWDISEFTRKLNKSIIFSIKLFL